MRRAGCPSSRTSKLFPRGSKRLLTTEPLKALVVGFAHLPAAPTTPEEVIAA